MSKILLYKAYRYLIKKIPRLNTEYFYELDIGRKGIKSKNDYFETSQLTLNNLKLLPHVFHQMFKERLSNTSDIGYLIIQDDNQYAFLWVATENIINIKEIGKTVRIQDKEAWIYHVYTSEYFRNKGASSLLVEKVVAFLSENNYKKVKCYTDKYNHGMQNVLTRNGFKLYKKYSVLSLFGKCISYRSKTIINQP